MGVVADEPLDATAWVAILSQRVLVVADVSSASVHGGAERMLHHHIRALVAAGKQVTILTRQPTPDDALMAEITHLAVVEHRLPFSGHKGYQGLKQLKSEARLWWQKHQNDFDVVVAEQPFVMWALMQAGCDLPRLQVCFSFAFEEYETRYGLTMTWKHKLAIAAMRKLEAKVYQSADRLMGLSQFTQDRLQDFFHISAEHGVVNPAAAEAVAAFDDEKREQYRHDLGWTTPVITTLRNLVPRTGVDLLIQVAAIVKAKRADVRFVVMGDGVLRDSMQKLAEDLDVADVVEFTGFLAEQDVQQRLIASDVFMVPTRGLEGFGLVTLEANVCGTPVLATPISANKELVPTVIHNQLAENASPLALAEKLMWMLDNPVVATQRKQVQDDVMTKYNWAKHDKLFVQLVDQLRKENL